MNTDPIADCFSRLRNAARARREFVEVPYSKMKESVLNLLREEGFLTDVVVETKADKHRSLKAYLKYATAGQSALEHIKRISKPGQRVYRPSPDVTSKIRGGLGLQILSTSKGVLTDAKASKLKVGGEVLGEVW